MHRVGVTAIALSLVTGPGGFAAATAAPGHDVYPSKQQVNDARHRAADAADDVAGIKAQLVQADLEAQAAAIDRRASRRALQRSAVGAAQARRDARVAERHSRTASSDARHQKHTYAATVIASYEIGPSLSPISALQSSDGLKDVVDRCPRCRTRRTRWTTCTTPTPRPSTLAGVASDQADTARATAVEIAAKARSARDAATSRPRGEQASQDIAARKHHLIHRPAALEHTSVPPAQKRQAGIEQAAREAAQRAGLRRRPGRKRRSRPRSRRSSSTAEPEPDPSPSPLQRPDA